MRRRFFIQLPVLWWPPLFLLLLSFLSLVGAAAGCRSSPRPDGPRLVVLYATCTLGKGFLGPYDEAVGYTPNLDRFARDAVVFERHQTESGQSGTAFASIFSGAQAPYHGIFSHPNTIADDVELVTAAFARAGYETHSFLAHQMASAKLGYARGVADANVRRSPLRAEQREFRRLLRRLRDDPDLHAFVVTNFTVTHGPYRTHWLDAFCESYPDECEARNLKSFDRDVARYRRHMRLLGWDLDTAREQLGLNEAAVERLAGAVETVYKSTVFELDRLFGAVLDAIEKHGLFEDSLIAFTADHGEILHRDNAYLYWTHGFQLAPEVLGVPWMLSGPSAGVRPGRYEGVTRSIDVFPTLAGLAGVAVDATPEHGVDLAPVLRGLEPEPRLQAFSHTPLFQQRYWDRFRRYGRLAELFPEPLPELMWVGVRDGDLMAKLRRTDAEAWQTPVFDLGADPGETRDIFDSDEPRHVALVDALHAYKERLVARAYEANGTVPRARSLRLLRELGYID